MTRPTLHQVAASAGVSLASASRALSGGVASPRTVVKVRDAARELGYVPHSTARALRTGAPRRVTFAVDDIGNPNYVEMLRSIEEVMGQEGPTVAVASTGAGDRTAELVRREALAADGLILSPLRVNEKLLRAIDASPIPIVVIGSLGEAPRTDVVRVDSAQGIGMAVEHVTGRGHRNIAFLNGPVETNPGTARQNGFFRAVRRLGLDEDRCVQHFADDFTVTAGYEAATHLFSRWASREPWSRPDAVVAANDLLAIGAMNAAFEAGLNVPRDVVVTGVDDTELAAVYNPSLTSVSLFAAERGRLAAKLLLARFREPGRDVETVSVTPQLVVRRSTSEAVEQGAVAS